MKKLKEQLKSAEDELSDTKRDHANDMQSEGYDKLSDDLQQMLEDTEYEISHNADKQLEIIDSMLNKAVGKYQDAYNKINSIISNFGWVGSTDFNNNQNQMSSLEGAQSQKDNASQSQSDANKNPSSSASGTITDPIKDNAIENGKITEDIMSPENTENRPVAELKIDKTSVTLEEGKSTAIKATIRPNDAKNKTLSWKSSNTAVATASNGTIKAIKPGSCTVTVSTTDGSGISKTIAVTVTKKPEPPKPAKKPSVSTGGDGIPRVGDVVTFTGRYYYDSWGMNPAGTRYSGVPNGVVIDSYSSKDYGGTGRNTGNLKIHIKSADGRYGNLGWVSLSQISGYENGTLGVGADQLAWTGEDNKREIIVRKSDGAKLTKLHRGDGVIPNNETEKLMALSAHLDEDGNIMFGGQKYKTQIDSSVTANKLVDSMINTLKLINDTKADSSGNMTIQNTYGSLINVEGNVDKDTFPGTQKMAEYAYEYIDKRMTQEARKLGLKKIR